MSSAERRLRGLAPSHAVACWLRDHDLPHDVDRLGELNAAIVAALDVRDRPPAPFDETAAIARRHGGEP
jgi:hypothetical protein